MLYVSLGFFFCCCCPDVKKKKVEKGGEDYQKTFTSELLFLKPVITFIET